MISILSVKSISRGEGRTACAAAAYRAGEKIESEYTGETYDYTRKGNVVYTEIMLPENAPDEYRNRSVLWNRVEDVEKRPDARLATEIMIPLPRELTLDQQIDVCRKFCSTLTDKGIICDFCIHNPPDHDDLGRPLDKYGNPARNSSEYVYNNPHVHIMMPQRVLDESGKFMQKKVGIYQCVDSSTGEQKNLTQAEIDAADGRWEKQYQYLLPDGTKQWMAKSVGESSGYERTTRYPLKLRHGIANGDAGYISSKEFVPDVRKTWEHVVNQELELAGIAERVDMRSYKDQGIDKISQVHEGSTATQMDRKADRLIREGHNLSEVVYSRLHDINKEIRKHNHMLDVFSEKERDAVQIQAEAEKYNRQLELYKEAWISAKSHHMQLEKELAALDKDTSELRERVQTAGAFFHNIRGRIQQLQTEKEDLKEQLSHSGSGAGKAGTKLESVQRDLQQTELILQRAYQMYGYSSARDYQNECSTLRRAEEMLRKKGNLIKAAAVEETRARGQFYEYKKSVPVRVRKYVAVNRYVTREQTIRNVESLTGAVISLISMATEQVIEEIEEEEWQAKHQSHY